MTANYNELANGMHKRYNKINVYEKLRNGNSSNKNVKGALYGNHLDEYL